MIPVCSQALDILALVVAPIGDDLDRIHVEGVLCCPCSFDKQGKVAAGIRYLERHDQLVLVVDRDLGIPRSRDARQARRPLNDSRMNVSSASTLPLSAAGLSSADAARNR